MISNVGIYDHGYIGFYENRPILEKQLILLEYQFIFPNMDNDDFTIFDASYIMTSGSEYKEKCKMLSKDNAYFQILSILVFDNNACDKYILDYIKRRITKKLKKKCIHSNINVFKTDKGYKGELSNITKMSNKSE